MFRETFNSYRFVKTWIDWKHQAFSSVLNRGKSGVFCVKGGNCLNEEVLKEEKPVNFRAHFRKWILVTRDGTGEAYRRYFHTVVVTGLMVFNFVFLSYSGLVIYLSRLFRHEGDVRFLLLKILDTAPAWIIGWSEVLFIHFDQLSLWWFFVISQLPLLTWLYSTITLDIKKGYKTLISWTSKRGRVFGLVMFSIPWIAMSCAILATYVHLNFWDFFSSIRLADNQAPHLLVRDMEFIGYLLYVVPVFFWFNMVYLAAKDFYVLEDLRDNFWSYEFRPLARQSFNLRGDSADVMIGVEESTKKPIVLTEKSRYLHQVVLGPTGSGKTSQAILPQVLFDLIRISKGAQTSVVICEPKGDLVRDVVKMCAHLGIPENKVKIIDPTDKAKSIKFNPFAGPMQAAAEGFRGTLSSLAGDQDEFFKGQQEETAAQYTLLAKIRYGDMVDIGVIQRMFTDPRYLADMVETCRIALDDRKESVEVTKDQKADMDLKERIVSYFENEVLEYKTQRTKDGELPVLFPDGHKYAGKQVVVSRKDQYITGAKKYLNDITMNAMLMDLFTAQGEEEIFNPDKFLEEGGVLLVNTELGSLEELSILFGQFFIRQFQSSVFRRPPEENGYKRKPTFFYVDEYALYANEAFERLLTLGRSYRVGTTIALQSLGQLDKVIVGHKNTILTNASNKIVFGRSNFEDNELLSKQFGEEFQVEESMNESTTPVTIETQKQQWGYRYNTQRKLALRFTATDIQELPFGTFIAHVVNEDGSISAPKKTLGRFVNEMKEYKKYTGVGKLTLETQNSKAIDVKGSIENYKHLVSTAFERMKSEVLEKVKDAGKEQEDSLNSKLKSDEGVITLGDAFDLVVEEEKLKIPNTIEDPLSAPNIEVGEDERATQIKEESSIEMTEPLSLKQRIGKKGLDDEMVLELLHDQQVEGDNEETINGSLLDQIAEDDLVLEDEETTESVAEEEAAPETENSLSIEQEYLYSKLPDDMEDALDDLLSSFSLDTSLEDNASGSHKDKKEGSTPAPHPLSFDRVEDKEEKSFTPREELDTSKHELNEQRQKEKEQLEQRFSNKSLELEVEEEDF
jgi:hypothetical protein